MSGKILPNGDSNYPFNENLLSLHLLLLSFLIFIFFFKILLNPHLYWRKRKVLQTSPPWLLGDIMAPAGKVENLYNYFPHLPDLRYLGFYNALNPVLLVKDPELINDMTGKNHEHFHDHVGAMDDSKDPLWDKNLFALKGAKWKRMRTTLSPAFTPNRLKEMFGVISQTVMNFREYFINNVTDVLEVDVKSIFSKYTNDVIATVAFGVKIDSLEDPNNEFYKMAKEATNLGGIMQKIKFIILTHLPLIARMLRLSIFTKAVGKFFTELVKNNIAQRLEQRIVRLDMIHLLLQARKGKLKPKGVRRQDAMLQEITDIDITAQALIFFFAGFDTVSSLICFMCYELAINTEIQEKLIEEVDRVSTKVGNTINYDSLADLVYMGMVIEETLRKWPNNPSIDRVCTKSYKIEPKLPTESPLTIEVGTIVWFPVYAIHRDPKYYPDPEHFNPERFSKENKKYIKQHTYMPFGNGPRTCIGFRFAIMETKVLFFQVLLNFRIVKVEKTNIPIKLSTRGFNITPKDGCFLGLKLRKNLKVNPNSK